MSTMSLSTRLVVSFFSLFSFPSSCAASSASYLLLTVSPDFSVDAVVGCFEVQTFLSKLGVVTPQTFEFFRVLNVQGPGNSPTNTHEILVPRTQGLSRKKHTLQLQIE